MKNKNLFKGMLLSSCLAIFGVTTFSGCDEDNDDMAKDEMFTVSGNASGSQEVPAVTESGTATLSGNYNRTTNKLDYSINWTGLTGDAVAAHFHGPATVGVGAGVLVPINLTTNGINGKAEGSVVIADSVETALLDGKVYYNLHTALHPNGEIRGQVTTTAK